MSSMKVYGLGINEAAVQYITAKALGYTNDFVKYYGITFDTISPNFYPVECNLINQMIYITGEYTLFDSTFYGNNDFKNKFIELTSRETYNTIETNFDKILFAEEDLIKLNNKLILEEKNGHAINLKISKLKETIKNTYFETQNLIISAYFNKQFNNLYSIEDVENFRRSLYNYKNIIGITENYFFFNNYYISMMEKLEAKRTAIENGTIYMENVNTDISPKKKNSFLAFLIAIKSLFSKQENQYGNI